MISRLLNTLCLLVPCLVLTNCRQSAVGANDATRIKEQYKKADQKGRSKLIYQTTPSKIIYGKVVDSDGTPVGNADVSISWFEVVFPLDAKPQKAQVVSDSNGCFQYQCRKPLGLINANAKKRGYVSEGLVSVYTDIRETSEDAPAVVVLRKIGKTTFLLGKTSEHGVGKGWFERIPTNGVNLSFDIFRRADKRVFAGIQPYDDFLLTAHSDKSIGGWRVNITTTNKADGVFLSENILYSAPSNGYAQNISFTVTNSFQSVLYLFLKSRDPLLYSRVRLEYGQLKGDRPGTIYMSQSVTINPYGERTFEYDERLDQFWREKKKWVEDAKAALHDGRYPEKIDIDAFIKAKEKEKDAKGER